MSSHFTEDLFLGLVKKDETKIKIGVLTSPNTIFLEGVILGHDDDTLILNLVDKSTKVIIYKHAIATIST